MKKDGSTWKSFELHCMRKKGENETKVAQIKNILENRFEDEEKVNSMSPIVGFRKRGFETSFRYPKKFDKHVSEFEDFSSEKVIPSIKKNFKRIAYQKVSEISVEEEPQSNIPVEKSIILFDGDGKINVSRANFPFQTMTGGTTEDSTVFMSKRRATKTNMLKSVDKSQDMYSDYSESIDYDSELEDEQSDNIKARQMPCLKSICKNLRK